VRINAGADKGPNPNAGPEYVLPGAQIDYFVAPGADRRPVTLSILDQSGRLVRRFSSEGPAAASAGEGGEDDGLGTYRPVYQTKLDARPGMHRFIWDLRYSGEPQAATPVSVPTQTRQTSPKPGEKDESAESRPRPQAGPVAPPGTYTVQMQIGGTSSRQPLTIVEDPRVLASGVTQADLQGLFDHNMRVLKLVNDTNLDVARVNRAMAELKKHPDAEKERALRPIADRLITSKVRYSQPALQTHVTYLYSETNGTDQKVGGDAIDRYAELRAKIDAVTADLDRVLGPLSASQAQALERSGQGTNGTQDTSEEDDDS
jgi:hypothetical protein